MPSAQVKALVQTDPLGLLTMLRDRMSREKSLVSFDPSQEGYVSQDGRGRLVVVKPKGAPFDTDFCKALFQRLSAVESAARQETAMSDPEAAAVTIQAAGAYRVALETEALIRRESVENSIGSMVILLLVVFGVFRTPWVMLYGCAPLVLGALLTLGLNGLIKGSLSPATSGSAGMLFGLGIDGVVLLYLRYLEERRTGASVDDAIRGMSGTASSVVLAQMTTAATFLALLLIDFPTLQDLGSLVGLGILLCCGLTVILLPALLSRRTGGHTGQGLTTPWLGRFVTRRATPIVWGSVIITVALAAASLALRVDLSIERLQAQTDGTALEQQVAARFSLPRDVLLVLDESDAIEPLLETGERLERALAKEAPSVLVGGIGFMLPSERSQAAIAQVILDSRTTSGEAQAGIETAARSAGFRQDTFVSFLDRLPRLLDPAERVTFDGLMSHGLGPIVSRFLVHRNDSYQGVTYLYPQPTTDLDALTGVIKRVDPRLRLTGLPAINHELSKGFFPQFLKGLAVGTAAVSILIYMVFRRIRHTLLALLPTVMGFIWSAGLLALFRVELDLFSLFAAVTFVGIAVDYGIYILYRHVFERPRDMNDVVTRTGAAIIIACGTALIGFGTLVNSSYRPLHVFGIVSIVTLSCCLVASVVSLPALVLETERWSPSAR